MECYDLAIIGAGVTGSAAAREFARYKIRCVVLEKEADASFGVSKSNSGIIHGGFHYSAETTLKGRLELEGNALFDELRKELSFPFRRCGILVAAWNEEQLCGVRKLYEQGVKNGVPGIEFCSGERMMELEKNLSPGVLGGLYAPRGGVIEPYKFVFALCESACRNGVEFRMNFPVVKAVREGNMWTVRSRNGDSVQARFVINAAGLYADEISGLFGGETFRITPRKGEEYLLDRNSPARPEKVIFPVPTGHSKGVLVIPTAEGTTMIGPTAEEIEDKTDRSTTEENREKIFALAGKMVRGVHVRDLITAFSGSRPAILPDNEFFLKVSRTAPGFIQAAGIQSPGLTASPAVARYLVKLAETAGLKLVRKETWIPEDVPVRPFRECTPEEAEHQHTLDPARTHIVCRCEKITEAEIVNAVRHGHTTLDGVKLYCRAGMGRCQGGFCTGKIMKIISRETGIPLEQITRKGGNTVLASGKLEEVKKLSFYGVESCRK